MAQQASAAEVFQAAAMVRRFQLISGLAGLVDGAREAAQHQEKPTCPRQLQAQASDDADASSILGRLVGLAGWQARYRSPPVGSRR